MERYRPTWESLSTYTVPTWFEDAKLGIFIHWGTYAVPAFDNEWYPRNMYRKGSRAYQHHLERWGAHHTFGYKDFIPMFRAERWDPAAWVELFVKAGARYIVPVAEHHDGFPMYRCSFTNWNAAQMGPRRDVIAELATEARRAGLKFGLSTHRAFNFYYYTFDATFDTSDPTYSKLYGVPHSEDAPVTYTFILDWYARVLELIDLFSPDLIYFDFGWHRDEFGPWRPRIAAHYYNHALKHSYEPVLTYKDERCFPEGVAIFDVERGKLNDIRSHHWQSDTSVSYKSWGYIENDEFRTTTSIVHDLVDIVSKNGNLLLNVGPRADGTIPHEAETILLELGRWLEVNGEAIYGTRPWTRYGEGPTGIPAPFREREQAAYTAKDVRFTTKGETLYAILLGWPEGEAVIKSLASDMLRIHRVSMLGWKGDLTWSQDAQGLRVKMPPHKPCAHAYTLKIFGQ